MASPIYNNPERLALIQSTLLVALNEGTMISCSDCKAHLTTLGDLDEQQRLPVICRALLGLYRCQKCVQLSLDRLEDFLRAGSDDETPVDFPTQGQIESPLQEEEDFEIPLGEGEGDFDDVYDWLMAYTQCTSARAKKIKSELRKAFWVYECGNYGVATVSEEEAKTFEDAYVSPVFSQQAFVLVPLGEVVPLEDAYHRCERKRVFARPALMNVVRIAAKKVEAPQVTLIAVSDKKKRVQKREREEEVFVVAREASDDEEEDVEEEDEEEEFVQTKRSKPEQEAKTLPTRSKDKKPRQRIETTQGAKVWLAMKSREKGTLLNEGQIQDIVTELRQGKGVKNGRKWAARFNKNLTVLRVPFSEVEALRQVGCDVSDVFDSSKDLIRKKKHCFLAIVPDEDEFIYKTIQEEPENLCGMIRSLVDSLQRRPVVDFPTLTPPLTPLGDY